MSDGPEWFAPKRYGIGAGLPIAWQGWTLLAVYLLMVCGTLWGLEDHPAAVAVILVPATVLFMMICARTTRHGWRWRWGEED